MRLLVYFIILCNSLTGSNAHNEYYCKKSSKCENLNFTTCLGAKLPYLKTSLEFTGLNSEEQVQEKLSMFKNSIYLPKCWSIIQPFLCSWFMPKCENNEVRLPSSEVCKSAQKLCATFFNYTNIKLFNCNDTNFSPQHCNNYFVDLNTTRGVCMEPLIKTDQDDSFYPGIEGCGLSCKDPFYTESEHRQIQKLVVYCATICCALTFFTVSTLCIDWKSTNKYPSALAIFYINVCFLVSYFGWLIQFFGVDTKEDIVCKKDGTLRRSEPTGTENLSCVMVFVMVYYSIIGGMVWFVIFTYCFYMHSLGKVQERVDKKKAYFHLVAWSAPLILTITTLALSEIDGDYISGICIVGNANPAAKFGLLLAPLGASITIGGYYITRGLIRLMRLKMEGREIMSANDSRKIGSNIVRMSVFGLFMLIFSVITFVYYFYRTSNTESWERSLYKYIKCKVQSASDDNNCKFETRPSLAMLQLQLIAVFGSGMAMASWIWCSAKDSWARFGKRKFQREIDEPAKLPKYKIIAQAFAKRQQFNQNGRISIECQNHSDPVGLNFELNNAINSDLSSTWAANLPRLITRRGAIPNEVSHSYSSNNQSIDSEMSFSVRHVSIESRRNSMDSQLSVQIAELKATRKANGRRQRYRQKKHNIRKSSRCGRKVSKNSLRRESNTSLDSHFGAGAAQLLNAITYDSEIKKLAPNLKRRTAIAGLDNQHINNLLSNGKLVIPYNKSGSEDENVSVTYSESKFNVVLSNTLDLNDHLVMQSLRKGLQIEELKTSSDSVEEKHDYEERRESRSSKRSRYKPKVHYSSDSNSISNSDTSSCPELKQLVQSSLNSGVSMGFSEKNRGSKQSKTSIDVAVQANAKEITAAYDLKMENEKAKNKSKKVKTKENKNKKKGKNEKILFEKIKKSKEKYKNYGSDDEKVTLNV